MDGRGTTGRGQRIVAGPGVLAFGTSAGKSSPCRRNCPQLPTFYSPLLPSLYDNPFEHVATWVRHFWQPRIEIVALFVRMRWDPPTSTQHLGPPDLEEVLILSTIHSAKGLEWDVVFILSVVDGCIPSEMRRRSRANGRRTASSLCGHDACKRFLRVSVPLRAWRGAGQSGTWGVEPGAASRGSLTEGWPLFRRGNSLRSAACWKTSSIRNQIRQKIGWIRTRRTFGSEATGPSTPSPGGQRFR